ncbi:carboxylesterase/lipase family protein [Aurantiacibacter flavus]|uniref:Carboxylic ester hydrolase n=1 Tax=Aurantiacibacter flavus TaxID=3145232 RepID=A0ABV0D0G8_9SPHN
MSRGLAIAVLLCAFASPAYAQIDWPVAVDGGEVAGVPADGVVEFKGIPFARPPIDSLRWQPPQPVESWKGVLHADRFAPACPQLGGGAMAGDSDVLPAGEDEDCLYLNVWTAAESADEKRPVMVWIYGGGYRAGATDLPEFDGAALADKGVVFVSIAYRVGVLGFLAHPGLSAQSARHVSGNYGLLDQIAALDWIRRNIASFGGDPDRITIFGQSAGSMSTSYLAASPLATGKFHRLIGETGAGFGLLTPRPLAQAEAEGLEFARKVGADGVDDLRSIPPATLVRAAGPASGSFEPNRDGWLVPDTLAEIYRNGAQNDVDMLIGSNADEAGEDPTMTLAAYRERLLSIYGRDAAALLRLHPATDDAEARASHRLLSTISLGDYTMYSWARAQARTGTAPLYVYRFTQNPPIPKAEQPGGPDAAPPGAWHGAEIVYALGNLDSKAWPWSAADRRLSDQMMSYWVNFATSGNPNGAGLPYWPTYHETPGAVMQLGEDVGAIPRPFLPTMEILDRHLSR